MLHRYNIVAVNKQDEFLSLVSSAAKDLRQYDGEVNEDSFHIMDTKNGKALSIGDGLGGSSVKTKPGIDSSEYTRYVSDVQSEITNKHIHDNFDAYYENSKVMREYRKLESTAADMGVGNIPGDKAQLAAIEKKIDSMRHKAQASYDTINALNSELQDKCKAAVIAKHTDFTGQQYIHGSKIPKTTMSTVVVKDGKAICLKVGDGHTQIIKHNPSKGVNYVSKIITEHGNNSPMNNATTTMMDPVTYGYRTYGYDLKKENIVGFLVGSDGAMEKEITTRGLLKPKTEFIDDLGKAINSGKGKDLLDRVVEVGKAKDDATIGLIFDKKYADAPMESKVNRVSNKTFSLHPNTSNNNSLKELYKLRDNLEIYADLYNVKKSTYHCVANTVSINYYTNKLNINPLAAIITDEGFIADGINRSYLFKSDDPNIMHLKSNIKAVKANFSNKISSAEADSRLKSPSLVLNEMKPKITNLLNQSGITDKEKKDMMQLFQDTISGYRLGRVRNFNIDNLSLKKLKAELGSYISGLHLKDKNQLGSLYSELSSAGKKNLNDSMDFLKAANAKKAVPNQAVPNQAVPNQAVPNQAVPNQAVPNQAVPNQAVPNQAVPNTQNRFTRTQQPNIPTTKSNNLLKYGALGAGILGVGGLGLYLANRNNNNDRLNRFRGNQR